MIKRRIKLTALGQESESICARMKTDDQTADNTNDHHERPSGPICVVLLLLLLLLLLLILLLLRLSLLLLLLLISFSRRCDLGKITKPSGFCQRDRTGAMTLTAAVLNCRQLHARTRQKCESHPFACPVRPGPCQAAGTCKAAVDICCCLLSCSSVVVYAKFPWCFCILELAMHEVAMRAAHNCSSHGPQAQSQALARLTTAAIMGG